MIHLIIRIYLVALIEISSGGRRTITLWGWLNIIRGGIGRPHSGIFDLGAVDFPSEFCGAGTPRVRTSAPHTLHHKNCTQIPGLLLPTLN